MKKSNLKIIILLFVSIMFASFYAQSQTYYMTQPEGFAAGVTGGGTPTTSNTVTVTNETDFKAAVTGSKSVIIVSGTITFSAMYKVSFSNKTIIGLPGASLVNTNTTTNGGDGTTGILYLSGGSNIIIRNLIFVGPAAYDVDGNDNLSIKGASKVWVDHCEFRDGIDDCFDITGTSDNVTVSWCKITHLKSPIAGGSGGSDDHRYGDLIGGGETDYPADGGYSITWQYCWFASGNKDRMVRGRNTDLHFVSCYWNSSVASHYISLTSGSKGSKTYCENGVFVGSTPAMTLDKTGTFNCQIVNSIDGSGVAVTNSNINLTNSAVNAATITAPSYSYSSLPASQVTAAVTNTSCGAGATLQVTSLGVPSSSCSSSTVAVTGVSVSPTSASLIAGGTQQLTATIAPSNATNQSVTWSSSNTAVATVSTSGLVTAVAAGSATITVTTVDGSKTATSAITVSAATVAVTGVTLTPTSASIVVGGTTQLTAAVAPSNATNKNVTWSSSNTAIATVSTSGLVTAVAAGPATITVTTVDGSKTATSAITVSAATVAVTGITVTPTSASISVGGTSQLTATVAPSNATNKSVTWSSSNTAIATLSTSGLVTAVASGSATITVTTVDGSKTATSAITVTTTAVSTKYEAENGTLIYAGVESTYAGYSGTGYVNTSNKVGSGIEWSVSVASAGTYYIYFGYANKSTDMPGDVYVNGTKVSTVALSNTGGLTTYGTSAVVTVSLVAGTNVIKILSTTSVGLPNMDYVNVSTSSQKSSIDVNSGKIDVVTSSIEIAPNPIKVSGTISVELLETSNVVISLYNLNGNKVAEITNQNYTAGRHMLTFERKSLATGTYIIKMVTNGKVQTTKIIIID